MTDAILTVTEVMERWKCSRRSVLDAIHSGRLQAFKVGERAYRVRMDELERYERERAGKAA